MNRLHGQTARLGRMLRDPDEPHHLHVLALVFWRAALALAAFTCLIALWYGWGLLNAASAALVAPTTSSSLPSAQFDERTIDATLAAFSARETTYQELKTAPPPIADPSR
ncbi:MAG TPA: hypothetical protein VN495_00495 [Candidatus Paceibacterota bacterium]|nr:hypothetical protein [Candidatus Paceibacterota bacterium]